ncbi:MAG TPA: YkgJ family cysteine cluster protein [Geobacteraceae bacterium]|nr:YkgJ family cysteine cluster protein [Geobacteraceae bacterium]
MLNNSAELANYRLLVSRIDELTARIGSRFTEHIACRPGCSSCCRHITIFPVEAYALATALTTLSEESRPYLATLDEMREDGSCPLLCNDRCLAYADRPIICRTHGLPLLTEIDGQQKIDYCPENFRNISSLPGDGVMNLDTVNRTLVAINAQFVHETADPDISGKDRFSIAEIVRMALGKLSPG